MKNTGDGRRVARVEKEIQQVVAQYLISGIRTRLPGLVTVARVMMPGDLRTAKVYVSILGAEDQIDSTVELLQNSSVEIQRFIGQNLQMRFLPKLTFYRDHTTDQVLKIDRILHDLDKQKLDQDRQRLTLVPSSEGEADPSKVPSDDES